jgi:regulator of nucleoside diphosphate kinase
MNLYAKPQTETGQAPITITDRDKRHLEKMILEIRSTGKKEESLDALTAELNRAEIVSSAVISPMVVTMGSLVSIVDLDTSERTQHRLIFPGQGKGDDNEISVLSPIGASILGYRSGDKVEREVPAGVRRFRIAKVDNQPDAANC